MNDMSNLCKFAVLRENSSAQDIHTWIRAWEVHGRNGLCSLKDALAYVEDSVLVRYDRWQQDANTTAGDTFENLKMFLTSQMGLEAMNLVHIHIKSVQATYRNADPSAMVIATLEELGPFAGLHATKKAKPTSNAGKNDTWKSGAVQFEMLRKDAIKKGVSSETFDVRAAKNECVMCSSAKHKAAQCSERQGNAN
ncbi:hypothetical protein H4R20_000956 [Coemansia guatemalensis]|uniref:Uncharacterized protein n=1 Tax=Coemansia guatemalensis TaxID=2761395 RepID=A0A9W8LTP0_9FUNG|nr:hypothetical protein H4R20_000956 [Coemansia guatemalensis]